MRREKCLDLFKEKGYYIFKNPDERCDKEDIILSKNDFIYWFKENIKPFNFGEENFFDDEEEDFDKCTIYYDKDRVEIKIIKSLKDYVGTIIDLKNYKNNHIYYRGHSKWNYLLKPSIYREENKNILLNEDKLFRDIIASKPHFFNDCTTTLEKLVKMQHHGLPTRLLDLTDNPLIALFFSCNSNNEHHGEISIFNVPEYKFKYYDSDTVSVLSNLAKSSFDFNVSGFDFRTYRTIYMTQQYANNISKIDDKISIFNEIYSVRKLIHDIREEKPYFLNRIDPIHIDNCSVVVKPKMMIDRIINQSGAFVLFGINKTKDFCADLDINSEGYKQKKIIIPSIYKKEIMGQLGLFNINESTVFCDIDSTAKFFRDKYK